MVKTKAQKARAKKAKKVHQQPTNAVRAAKKAAKKARKASRKALKRAQGGKIGGSGPLSKSVSLVSDGVNMGAVWCNLESIEDRFPIRREKVCDLTSTGSAFAILKQFYLNPGNTVLFPIFSQIAATYEQYRCNHLKFYFRTEEYMASGSNVAAGLVVMGTNMDVDDSNFSGIDQMENYTGSISAPPFTGVFEHDVKVAHRKRGRNRGRGADLPLNDYFVYSSANAESPVSGAGKFYDIGNFQVASNNVQTATMGELWVEYSFTMIRPKMQTPLGQNLLCAHIVENPSSSAAASGSKFLGTTGGTLKSGSTLPCVATSDTFTLPTAGYFLVAACFAGSVTVVPTFTGGANITALTQFEDNLSAAPGSVSSNLTVNIWLYNVTAPGTGVANTVTITGLTNLASGTADIYISQVSSGLTLADPRRGLKNKSDGDNRLDQLYQMMMQQQSHISRLEHLLANRTLISEEDCTDEEKDAATSDFSSTLDVSGVSPGKGRRRKSSHLAVAPDGSSSSGPAPSKGWFRV